MATSTIEIIPTNTVLQHMKEEITSKINEEITSKINEDTKNFKINDVYKRVGEEIIENLNKQLEKQEPFQGVLDYFYQLIKEIEENISINKEHKERLQNNKNILESIELNFKLGLCNKTIGYIYEYMKKQNRVYDTKSGNDVFVVYSTPSKTSESPTPSNPSESPTPSNPSESSNVCIKF